MSDESIVQLETAVDNLIASAMQVKAERDELLAACSAAIECCGESTNWNGKTQAFLEKMEWAITKIDPEMLATAYREAAL